jgi:hypothetical protein
LLYAVFINMDYCRGERKVHVYRMLIVGLLLVVLAVAVVTVCGCPKTKSVEEYEQEKPEGFVPPIPPTSEAPAPVATPTEPSAEAPEAAPEKAPEPAGQPDTPTPENQ